VPLKQNKRVPFIVPYHDIRDEKLAFMGLLLTVAGLILSVIALINFHFYMFLFALLVLFIGRFIEFMA